MGYDVNTALLDGLAEENRGTVAYIEPHEDIEVKVSSFFAKVNNPVLSEIKIDWGGIETDLIYPRVTPDVFHGTQVVLMGRYRPAKHAATNQVTLTGKVNGRERRFVYDGLRVAEEQGGHEFLPHLWAMRRVGHLLDQGRRNDETKELRDEIVELGTRYGIVTPHTSHLVLEPEGARSQAMSRAGADVPSGFTGYRSLSVSDPTWPGGTGDSFARLSTGTSFASASTPPLVTGGSAVAFSKDKEALRTAERLEALPSSPEQIRRIGGKTFYLREGVWTDSEFKAGGTSAIVTLKFASEEYFKLLAEEPRLGECFALGSRVVVVWKEKVYRVEEAG